MSGSEKRQDERFPFVLKVSYGNAKQVADYRVPPDISPSPTSLDALSMLNMHNGATVSEVAQKIRLPRTTTYRILETLTHAGYVYRDPVDDRYRLTIMVHRLADGFDDDAWVTQIARPCIDDLGKEVQWPVAVASLSGTQMLVRETTDHRSPLAVERISAGTRLPLLVTAVGRAHLAFCPPQQRESLLEILRRSTNDVDAIHAVDQLDRRVDELRPGREPLQHDP